jgi:flagellar protein FlaJ
MFRLRKKDEERENKSKPATAKVTSVDKPSEKKKKIKSPQSFLKSYRPEKKARPLPLPKPKKKVQEQPVSTIYAMSYRLLNKRVEFLYPRLTPLEKQLAKAMMKIPYEAYICGMVMVGIIAGIAGIAIGAVITTLVVLTPPEFELFLPVIVGAVMFQVIFGVMYSLPSMNASGRRKKLGEELPFFIGFMAMLASSGLSIEGIFRAISKDESNDEIVKDSAFIMRNVDLLGMDILTSIDMMAKRSPHPTYTELLEGLIATVITGGSLTIYFSSTLHVMMEEKRMFLKRLTETMSIVAEMYTIMLVVFPLMAIIMLSIMAIMVPTLGGFGLQPLMQLLTYAFVPIIGGMMLMMIDGMLPKK